MNGLKQKFILKDGSCVEVRRAQHIDIPQILDVYKSIEITEGNIENILSENHEDNFRNRGGFFKILSKDELEKMLDDGKYIFIESVATEDDGNERVTSCLYCRRDIEKFQDMQWDLDNSLMSVAGLKDYKSALKNNRVGTAVEHAIHPQQQSTGVAYPVIYEMYQRLLNEGFTYVMLQIYNITGVNHSGSHQEVYLGNDKSVNLNARLGAVQVGVTSIPVMKVGDWEIEITSKVYALKLGNALKVIKGKVRPCSMRVV